MLKLNQILKAAVLSLTALLCVPVYAQDRINKRRVAVLEPEGNIVVTAMNKANVRGALTEIIVNTGTYTAVARSHTDRILNEHDFQRGELSDPSKAKELGKLLGADLICVTDLLREGGEFNIECSIIDVETGEITNSASEFLQSDSNAAIRIAAEELVRRMFRAGAWQFQAEEPKELKEPEVKFEREPEVNSEREPAQNLIPGAKTTINKLMPDFTFEKKGSGVSCVNIAMERYLAEQQQSVMSRKQDFWHSLVIKIDSIGGLTAHSKYVFRKSKDRLSHNYLSIVIGNETISTSLSLNITHSSILGVTTEEAQVLNSAVLRAIADNPEKQIQVIMESPWGVLKKYVLNSIVQRAIAQTLELYDAMTVLRQHGEEIRQRY